MFGARRTVVLWAVLLVLFMVFFTLFGGLPSAASPADGTTSPWLTLSRQWAPVLIFGPIFALFSWVGVGSNRLALQGMGLLEQGRYCQALEKFEAARARNRFTPLGPYNVGVALVLLWRLAPAEAALAQAEKGSRRVPFVRRNAPLLRALVAALAGRTEEARALLDRLDPEVRSSGTAQLARAVLACRQGAFAEVLTLVEGLEVRHLGAVQGALGGALRAWALAEETGEVRQVDRVALFGETNPEVVRATWPELVAFVERAPAG